MAKLHFMLTFMFQYDKMQIEFIYVFNRGK